MVHVIILNFLQFFVWATWLITIGAYWFQNKHWSGSEFGAVFSTMGISSIFTPTIAGIVADRWLNAEKLYGMLHILGALVLFIIPMVDNPNDFFWAILLCMLFYMPTIALSNSIGYTLLKRDGEDVVKQFPPIRVWGTIGFVAALWVISLTGNETSANQFYIGGLAELLLGLYAFTIPACPPLASPFEPKSLLESLGLNAFSLFKERKIALFFLFSMLLGASLQLTNAYGDTFLHDFEKMKIYKDSFAVKFPAMIMSISQISETVFVLLIPLFLKKLGIKKVMLLSMVAWTFRFGFLAFGNPGENFWMIILSCIVYGMAFDFFNISGSLFIETYTDSKIRSSVQGLFMMMVNGFGAVLGSLISGIIIQTFFTLPNGTKNWTNIWLCFASYSVIIAILFALFFKHKHDKSISKIHFR